jgi:hypothetical protein
MKFSLGVFVIASEERAWQSLYNLQITFGEIRCAPVTSLHSQWSTMIEDLTKRH